MNKLGCFIIIAILALNITVGAWSVGEILFWFGKNIPLWADILIGLFVGQFSIPIAVVGWLLKLCGVF